MAQRQDQNQNPSELNKQRATPGFSERNTRESGREAGVERKRMTNDEAVEEADFDRDDADIAGIDEKNATSGKGFDRNEKKDRQPLM